MSISTCEICKKETEHNRSSIQLFIGIILLLVLSGIIGLLGMGFIWFMLSMLNIYWIKKSWKGKCTECNKELINREENNIKEEKEYIKNNIEQIQYELKNGKSLLEIYNNSVSLKNLFSFSDFEKEFVEQVISLDSNNLKTHLDEYETKISSKSEALKYYKEKIKNNYKKIKIDVLNGISIEDIYKTYINPIHSELFSLAEFKQSCFDEFKKIKEEEKKVLIIEEMKNKAEEITFLKVFTVMLLSGISITLILAFISSFSK